jgi:hypothetical protein
VDEGRHPDAEDARAREGENDGNCAEAQANRRRDPAEGDASRCDSGRRSREEKGVKVGGGNEDRDTHLPRRGEIRVTDFGGFGVARRKLGT